MAYRNRADLYASQLEDLDKALEDYNKAVTVEPENSYNYEMRGIFTESILRITIKPLKIITKGLT